MAPRGRHHPLKRSVEGLDGRALNTVSLRHGDETWRCGNSALCASRAEGVICHAEYRRADALPCRGAFKRLTAHAAHPDEVGSVCIFGQLCAPALYGLSVPCVSLPRRMHSLDSCACLPLKAARSFVQKLMFPLLAIHFGSVHALYMCVFFVCGPPVCSLFCWSTSISAVVPD
jgi:hypothetical protein